MRSMYVTMVSIFLIYGLRLAWQHYTAKPEVLEKSLAQSELEADMKRDDGFKD